MPNLTLAELVEVWLAKRKTWNVKPPSRANPKGRITRHVDNVRSWYKVWVLPTPDPEATAGLLWNETGRTLADLRAQDLTPLRLEACKQRMIDDGRAREYINKLIRDVWQMYRWAASPVQKHVPPDVWKDLETVELLRQGRTLARETQERAPVPDHEIKQTERKLMAIGGIRCARLHAMIGLQVMTGMRPCEVVQMSRSTIDMTPDRHGNWHYTPEEHKTQHKGKSRIIPLGPSCQVILLTMMQAWHGEWLFPGDDPNKHMHAASYRQALNRIQCEHKLHVWTPGRLRHTFASWFARATCAADASLMLGHSNIETTQKHYIAKDLDRASELAARFG